MRLHLSAIVESSHDAIISKSLDGTITSWNPGAQRLFGYSAEEIVGKPITLLFPPDRSEEEAQIVSRLKRGERVEHIEAMRIRKDGRRIQVSATISPIKDRNGQVTGASKIVRDITERVQAQKEIQRLNEDLARRAAQLEVANKELEAFSYSVSHDLRAPLRHIDGFLELLQKKAGSALDAKCQRYVGMISESAREMGTLIDDLLSFSRMGRGEMRTAQVNLEHLVHTTIRDLGVETSGRDISWKVQPLPEVQGDCSLLRQVFVNLLSNAVKYTRTRARSEIEIGCLPSGNGEDAFFVRDNGVGFDMKYADKLFGVFQRLHEADEFEGTGIGLANVQRIVCRHGGRVWADAIVDEGATFYFSLPKSPENKA